MISAKTKFEMLPLDICFFGIEDLEEDVNDQFGNMQAMGVDGRTLYEESGHLAIILNLMKGTEIGLIVHEAEHATDYVEEHMEQEYIRFSEYRAYLIGFITEFVVTSLLKNGYYPKKFKKKFTWTKG